jgi:hypothetical protein
MSKVAAFPGVTLTAREIGSETPPRLPVTSTSCPVCPAPIRSDCSTSAEVGVLSGRQ